MYGRRQAWDDESDLDDDFVYYEEDYYYPQDYGYNGPLNSPKIYPGRQNLNRGEDWTMPGPHTGHGPRGYRRSDERIKEDVCERLTRHGYLDASDIDVDVKDGEVTLRGSVSSRRAKRMAEDTAETVSGVWDVHNELHLSNLQSGGQGRRDEVGHSGVFPASGGSAPGDAEAHGMASWGQGERGAAGYEDSGRSELHLDKPSEDQS